MYLTVYPSQGTGISMTEAVALEDPDFDEVVRDHPLVARRLPVLRNHHPRWKYDVALVVNAEDDLWGASEEPTVAESEQLVAYLEFRLRYYNEAWRQRMLDRYPFDIDGSVNTYTFRKCPEVGWQYNARSWTMHVWFPQRGLHEQRYATLEALLDKVNTYGGDGPTQKWLDFKAESPAFGTEATS